MLLATVCRRFSALLQQPFILHLAALLILWGFFIVLFWSAPNWWYGDDPAILLQSIRYSFTDFFFPRAWRELSYNNLTPWVLVSFKLDYLLFGLRPLPFYLHQWLSMALAILLFYKVCRWWFSRMSSGAASLCLMLSLPMLGYGHHLMTRHYVEGLIFMLAALICFLNAGQKNALKYLGGFFFLLACTAKEIFIPMPLAILFLPFENVKERLSRVWPMLAVLPIYTLWRIWMLEGFGGYARALSWNNILCMPTTLLNMTGFTASWHHFALLILAALWLWQSSWKWRLFIAVTVTATIMPLIPVAGMMKGRYCIIPAILFAALIGWLINRASAWRIATVKGAGAIALCLLMLGQFFWGNLLWQKNLGHRLQQHRIEGEFLLTDGSSGDYILKPSGSPWFYSGLQWLRLNELRLPPGPDVIYDAHLHMEKANCSQARYYLFNTITQRLEKIDASHVDETFERLSPIIRENTPMFLDMSYKRSVLSWHFGPWEKGNYALFTKGAAIEYPLFNRYRQQGRNWIPYTTDLDIILRYASPEGWVSYSPALHFKTGAGEAEISWESSDWEAKLADFELPAETRNIRFHIDELKTIKLINKEALSIRGWAFKIDERKEHRDVYFVLKGKNNTLIFDIEEDSLIRNDVTKHFNMERDHNPGFSLYVMTDRLKENIYQIGFIIDDESGEYYQSSTMALSKTNDAWSFAEAKPFFPSKKAEISIKDPDLSIKHHIDSLTDENDLIKITGWGFLEGLNTQKTTHYVVFKKGEDLLFFDTTRKTRKDVTGHFKEYGLNLDNAGFEATVLKEDLESGCYQIGLYIVTDNNEGLVFSDKCVSAK